MKVSELKYNVENTGSNFFSRSSMKFAGDTMVNYGVRSQKIRKGDGEIVDCWELYRIKPVKYGNQKSVYFRKDNYKRVFFCHDTDNFIDLN